MSVQDSGQRVALSVFTSELVKDMLTHDSYKRTWPPPTHLLEVGGVLKLEASLLYTATRMIRAGTTPPPRGGAPLWTAWALALGLTEVV